MSDSRSRMGTSSYMEISSMKSKSQPERRMERAMATQAETLEWHKKRWGQRSSNLLLPPLPCPTFSSLAVMGDGLSEWVFNSKSFTGDYVLLLFLPMDGSVDKAELKAFNDELEQLESLGCQVRKHLNQIQNINLTSDQTRWSLSQGTVWLPFVRFLHKTMLDFSTTDQQALIQNLSMCSQLICSVVCFHPSWLPYHQ